MPRFRFSVAGLFLGVTFCALLLGLFVPAVRLAIRPDLWVESLAMSANGSRVAAIVSDGGVQVWEADTGEEVADFAVTAPIGSIAALSADGRILAVRPGWTDRIPPGPVAIQLWDLNERRELAPSEPTMGGALALAPEQHLVAVCDMASVKLLRWDEPDQPPSGSSIGENLSEPTLAFSPDGKLLACCSHDWEKRSKTSGGPKDPGNPVPSPLKVKLIDCEHEQTTREFDGPAGTFAHTSLSFSPDGRQLAVCVGFDFGYGDGRTRKSLEIRDIETGKLTASLPEANFGWWRPSVAFLPDGQSVAVAGDDLLVWDSKTQKRLSNGAAFDSIRCVTSGREGNLFATGGRSVTIWDATKRTPLRTLWGSRVAGPSWLLLPGFAGWLVGWMALRSRKLRLG